MPKISPVDKRIVECIDALKAKNVIRFDTDFCRAVNIQRQNLAKVKRGESHFRVEHISKAVKIYKMNPNWIFGVETKMFLPLI